jgi:signal transduction histidine kinase
LSFVLANGQTNSIQKVDSAVIKEIDSLFQQISVEFFKKNYEKSIEYGERAIKLSEEYGYYNKYYGISSFMGNSYVEIKDSIRAKRAFSQSIETAERLKDTIGIIISEIDFANFYALTEENSKKEIAIDLYKNTLVLAEKIKSSNNLLLLNSNIAELYLDIGNYTEAAFYIQQTKKYINDSVFIGFRGSDKLNTARLLIQEKKPKQALENLSEGLNYLEQLSYVDGIIDIYHNKAIAEKMLNDYKSAYESMMILDSMKAKKYETDKIEIVESVRSRYKLEEIEQSLRQEKLLSEINEQRAKRETRFLWMKIASGLLLIIFTILLYSYIKRKKLLENLIVKNKQYLEEKERSEELSKAKSVLFSNITHELRTPMYGIIGISNILLEDKRFEEQKTSLKSLKFSADYLLALVNNILHFTNIETTKDKTKEISEFDIRTLIFNIIESAKFLSEDHPNTYNVTMDDSIPNIVKGDLTRLSQILFNLISNATKFTNDGVVDISLTTVNKKSDSINIEFSIKDNGTGISEEKQKIIFNELSQIGEGQRFMGTGLGLPIVKNLLDQLGSALVLTSEVGKGTKVSFPLSFTINDNSVKPGTITPVDSKKILKGKTILAVDDNQINLMVTKKVVERFGATVLECSSGAAAIEIVKERHIDLILMDINMPEMNGFEATKRIRSLNKNIPIIALTAVEKEKVVGDNAFNLMNGIIIKPYSNDKFVTTVCESLGIKVNGV